jgi:hypothetical protein
VKAAVVNAWDVRPTLERIVACSSGRLVCCRLIKPPSPDPTPPAAYRRAATEHAGILSRPAPQPAPGDPAVALPTTTAFTGIVRAPEPSGDTPPRPIPLSTSLRALPGVPSDLVVCAGHPEPCPAATGDSGFTIEIGSDSVIGPTELAFKSRLPLNE